MGKMDKATLDQKILSHFNFNEGKIKVLDKQIDDTGFMLMLSFENEEKCQEFITLNAETKADGRKPALFEGSKLAETMIENQ